MNLPALSLSILNSICGRLFKVHLRPHPLGGDSISQPDITRNEPILEGAMRRLAGHKIEIGSLIDIGASDGIWSKAFAKEFPGRHHLLVDANQVHLPKLTQVCRENPNWQFVMTAVGDRTGELYFDASDPLGGHLSATPWTKDYLPCPVTTIDHLLEKYPLPGPFMIKLDTHGVELPILAGAARTLKETSVIVIEAYNFTFGEPAVPFWDLCRHMLEIGFRPLDVFDLLYREVDNEEFLGTGQKLQLHGMLRGFLTPSFFRWSEWAILTPSDAVYTVST
jgi:FkbM family methyltransferase